MNTIKIIFYILVICLFFGCVRGKYHSNLSVAPREGGVHDYSVVYTVGPVYKGLADRWDVSDNLEEIFKSYSSSTLPIVVDTKSETKNHEVKMGISRLFFMLTLGVIPIINADTTTGAVTIQTPLGTRSGWYDIENKEWLGWLPLFLPYPGGADQKFWGIRSEEEKVDVERNVRDRLVRNLVSQFSKEEFENNYARPKREAQKKESVSYKRSSQYLHEVTVTEYLEKIKKCYSDGKRYLNPFRGSKGEVDWLSKWTSPRLNTSEADVLSGQVLLSAFGTKYLPNAYANYEKKKDMLIEIQQIFNEEFPKPWTIKTTNPKWSSFNKVLEKFVKARTDFIIYHDKLCYYWLLHRFGVLTDLEFSEIDSQPLEVNLLPENIECAEYTLMNVIQMESKISGFAHKYTPESNAIYQKMAHEHNGISTLLAEVSKDRIKIDDVRYSRVFEAAVSKHNELVHKMNTLLAQLQDWCMNHRLGEMSAEDVDKADTEMAKKMKPFIDSLPNYIRGRVFGPVIADFELVDISCCKMQRTEVTQFQWMDVMGYNPSVFKAPDRPVDSVRWKECQEFLKRAREIDGRSYRLPTTKEWEYACRAGSKTVQGKRVNGECGPLEVMGWYRENSDKCTHPVGRKEPNAWGLFDMHGNVEELCDDGNHYTAYGLGGCWSEPMPWLSNFYPERYDKEMNCYGGKGKLGFRLVCY